MTKHRSIWEYVKASSLSYYDAEIKPEGLNHFLRALTAKLLWVALFYSSGYFLIDLLLPLEGILYNNVAVLVVGAAALEVWDKVIKDHAPEWCGDILTGKVFFKVDIQALNKYILYLFLANIVILAIPFASKPLAVNSNE